MGLKIICKILFSFYYFNSGKRTRLDCSFKFAAHLSKLVLQFSLMTSFIDLFAYYDSSYLVGFFFCGVLGVLLVFVTVLYLKSKERIYFYYLLFLLFNIIAAIITLKKYAPTANLTTPQIEMIQRNLEMITLFALFTYCIFTLKLLKVKKQNRKLAHWIIYLAGFTVIYGGIYWLLYPQIKTHLYFFFLSSRIIIFLMSFTAIIWLAIKVQSPFKSYFIIGSTFYFTGGLLAVLRDTTATIPLNSFYTIKATVYFKAGILLEVICFAMALSHRIYLLNQIKQKKQKVIREKAVYEKDLAKAEMLVSQLQVNPHFIFNSLNAIKYFIQSEQNDKAVKNITVFSRFVRMVLEESRHPLINLAKELDIIKKYLILENYRFNQKFTYYIDIDKKLNLRKIRIPPLLLLPFVEDAIWHRLLPSKNTNRKLLIKLTKKKKKVITTIEDNGTGFKKPPAFVQTGTEKNAGILISKKRIALYNKNYPGALTHKQEAVKIKNKKQLGTKMTVTIDF